MISQLQLRAVPSLEHPASSSLSSSLPRAPGRENTFRKGRHFVASTEIPHRFPLKCDFALKFRFQNLLIPLTLLPPSTAPRRCRTSKDSPPLTGACSVLELQSKHATSSLRVPRALSGTKSFFGQTLHSSRSSLVHDFSMRMGPLRADKATKAPAATEGKAETQTDAPKAIYLKDYKAPDYVFEKVNLVFKLGEEYTTVSSTINVRPRESGRSTPLVLNGADPKDLELVSVGLNGKQLQAGDFERSRKGLTISKPPAEPYTLEIVTKIQPQNNTSLEGLYKSSGNFCTQCEAEGFQRITFFQDRPDVMAVYGVRIEAKKDRYPVLLSNGNLVDQGDLEGGEHYAVWEDPFKKPCYLFALVAGQLTHTEDKFVTMSGKTVTLRIYVEEHNKDKTGHAMRSLKTAMKWDEDRFGREYDLDVFNMVAVDDFNMGAMENKSLNIFNSPTVLATPETATDEDYTGIEIVVGHEYFHNWTGNRVTCRDWFQLSLKEGLTIYREQEFSADITSRPVSRISTVQGLRSSQFPEDAGPTAHPVRPQSYIKMDNFYTATVYDKGAEVVGMYESLLGRDGFRKGMDLYFERHDGQAVTCDDFLAAMRDANQADLGQFSLWYEQSGTPRLTITSHYDGRAKTFTLKTKQEVPPTPGQPNKEPMLLPVRVGLLGPDGKDFPLTSVNGHSLAGSDGTAPTSTVLRVDQAEQSFTFENIEAQPVPSLLRNFSAPVRLTSDVTDEQLLFLLAHDSDVFNRWEAAQTLARKFMLDLVGKAQKGEELHVSPDFVAALKKVLTNPSLDEAFRALAIGLPSESELVDNMEVADPDAIHTVHEFVTKTIAKELKEELLEAVHSNRSDKEYVPDTESKARRTLKNTALEYLASLDDPEITAMALADFRAANNMTDELGALTALCTNPSEARDTALAEFYEKWKKDSLVMDKWLMIQGASSLPGNVENVKHLMEHPAFDIKNPNKVMSLIGGFTSSAVNFHAKDGSGYKFLAEQVLKVDKINATTASLLVSAFTSWESYDEDRQSKAKAELERIKKTEGLSENVYEVVSKSLDGSSESES